MALFDARIYGLKGFVRGLCAASCEQVKVGVIPYTPGFSLIFSWRPQWASPVTRGKQNLTTTDFLLEKIPTSIQFCFVLRSNYHLIIGYWQLLKCQILLGINQSSRPMWLILLWYLWFFNHGKRNVPNSCMACN